MGRDARFHNRSFDKIRSAPRQTAEFFRALKLKSREMGERNAFALCSPILHPEHAAVLPAPCRLPGLPNRLNNSWKHLSRTTFQSVGRGPGGTQRQPCSRPLCCCGKNGRVERRLRTRLSLSTTWARSARKP